MASYSQSNQRKTQLSLTLIIFFLSITSFSFAYSLPEQTATAPPTKILGRWDISINMNGNIKPAWLELDHSGVQTIVGRFVGVVGSARPVSEIQFNNSKFSFTIPPQWWVKKGAVTVKGSLKDDHLEGTIRYENGSSYHWKGQKAPKLVREEAPEWGQPITLFDGTNIDEWHATGENQWRIDNGVLSSPHSGANLVTNQKFEDFKLHIEVKYPKGSNSGIYLRGRYEMQVVDKNEVDPQNLLFGAIYGFIPASKLVSEAGEWQKIDITLIGRMVTVVVNGETIICNREIPGITGGALNSNEDTPGPILLQGDHGPIEYRNIVITPAK